MKKFVAGVVAGICVLSLALIPLFLEPAVFLQSSWKTISISLALLAVVCTVLQSRWMKEDEDRDEEERKRLYKLVQEILKNQEEQSKGHKGGRNTLKWQAASTAAQLLTALAETPPTVTEFDPVGHSRLFRSFEVASHTGRELWNQQQLLGPISRNELLGEVERLVMLAISADQDTDI